MTDYYQVLGVSKTASQEEIKKTFKTLAFQHHPDRNQGNPEAEAKFKEINEAYQVLGDPEKRQVYDAGGMDPTRNAYDSMFGNGAPDIESIMNFMMNNMGGNGSRNSIRGSIGLSFEEMIHGVSKKIEVSVPEQSVRGHMVFMNERRINLDVKFPPGSPPGSVIRVEAPGSSPSSKKMTVHLQVQPSYDESKFALVTDGGVMAYLSVPFETMILGGTIEIQLLDGRSSQQLKIPEGSQPNQKLRVKGQGLPKPRMNTQSSSPSPRGDLIFDLHVTLPKAKISQEAKECIKLFQEQVEKDKNSVT